MDTNFYQACGHAGCSPDITVNRIRGKNEPLCSTYVCKADEKRIGAGKAIEVSINCNGNYECMNTKTDEGSVCNFEEYFQCTDNHKAKIDEGKVCDLQCDCWSCEDEGFCNSVTYGIYCDAGKRGQYVPAVDVCDNGAEHCSKGEDEANCDVDIVRNCRLKKRNSWYPQFKEGIPTTNQSTTSMCSATR
jgi:hypothetical protein